MATRDQLANVIEKARDEAGRAGMYWAFHAADAVLVALGEELEPEWAECSECGVPIFRHYAWSHEGGTPPQDHEAEPATFVKRSAS